MSLAKRFKKRGAALFGAIVAGLSGCGSSDGALGETPTLTGQLVGWSRGGGHLLTAQTLTGQSLGSAPIAADGGFSLTLPGRDGVAAALDETMFQDPCETTSSAGKTLLSCESNIEPQLARRAMLTLSIPGVSQYVVHESRPWPTSAQFPPHSVVYEYWDSAVEWSTRQVFREPQESGPVTVTRIWDLHIKPGWNATIYYQPHPDDVALGTSDRSFVTQRPPSSFSWYCCEN
jgi:hypothetical protein